MEPENRMVEPSKLELARPERFAEIRDLFARFRMRSRPPGTPSSAGIVR